MHVLHERPLRHDGNAESVCFFWLRWYDAGW